MTDKPKTLAEKLDAARDGKEFAQVLNNLFGVLEWEKEDE